MHILKPKYSPVARSAVTLTLIPQMCKDEFKQLKTNLQVQVTLHFTCMLVNYKAIVYDLRAYKAVYL